ncbi:MAG: DUF4399 domain-containing protein [Caldilineales bacterium]
MQLGHTEHRAGRLAVAMSLLAVLVLAACSSGASSASVRFVDPKEGATVSNPVTVKMAADNFTVEPAGEVKAGHGHLHYGHGQVEATLELAPGSHTLCLQAADGAHVALPGADLTQKINIGKG